jgi:hypothetical protein
MIDFTFPDGTSIKATTQSEWVKKRNDYLISVILPPYIKEVELQLEANLSKDKFYEICIRCSDVKIALAITEIYKSWPNTGTRQTEDGNGVYFYIEEFLYTDDDDEHPLEFEETKKVIKENNY